MLADRKCSNCNHFEEDLIEKSGSDEYKECPVCHSLTFKRLVSMCSFDIHGLMQTTKVMDSIRQTASEGAGNF